MDARSKVKRFFRSVLIAPFAVLMGAGMDDILNPQESAGEGATDEGQDDTGTGDDNQDAAGDAGSTDAKVDPPAATTTEAPADVEGIKAAMLAERHKRQEVERQYAALQKAQEEAAAEEKPFLGEEYEQRFTETEARLREEVVQTKIAISESFMREKHADYDEKLNAFAALAKENPLLLHQARAAANPADFVYRAAANHLQVQKLQELGDPEQYRQKLREELLAELKAEQEAENKAKVEAAIRAKAKGGFSEVRSAGKVADGKSYTGPTPLKSILG